MIVMTLRLIILNKFSVRRSNLGETILIFSKSYNDVLIPSEMCTFPLTCIKVTCNFANNDKL